MSFRCRYAHLRTDKLAKYLNGVHLRNHGLTRDFRSRLNGQGLFHHYLNNREDSSLGEW